MSSDLPIAAPNDCVIIPERLERQLQGSRALIITKVALAAIALFVVIVGTLGVAPLAFYHKKKSLCEAYRKACCVIYKDYKTYVLDHKFDCEVLRTKWEAEKILNPMNKTAPILLKKENHPTLARDVFFHPEKGILVLDPIGTGSFKEAFRALWHGRVVAIVRTKLLKDEHSFMQECEMLQRCDSPYVARVEAIDKVAQTTLAIMPFYRHGDLFHALDTPKIRDRLFPKGKFHKTPLQIIQGVAAIHERRIIHRDLKPENIFLSDKDPVIADMGLSTSVDDVTRSIADPTYGTGDSGHIRPHKAAGSPFYLAPEIAQLIRHGAFEISYLRAIGFSNDNWALGIILYEYFLGHLIMEKTFFEYLGFEEGSLPTQDNLHAKIAELLEPAFVEDPSKRAWLPILKGLLQIHPDRRMTAAEAEEMAKGLEALPLR